MRLCLFAPLAGLGLLACAGSPARWPDPARDIVRVQIIVTTTAAGTSLLLDTGGVTNESTTLLAGRADIRLSVDGNALKLSDNIAGASAKGRFQLVVAGVATQQPVGWTLTSSSAGHTTVEVYNLNQEASPSLVDRFETDARSARFTSTAEALRSEGPLTVALVPTRLVLAHFYPWYDRSTWSNPQLLDRPAHPYSTDDPADVANELKNARLAGLDGLVVSWMGKDFQGGWNHRRSLLVLDAAQNVGLKVSTLLETTVANPQHEQTGVPADPNTVFTWLRDIVDSYASHPAYLQVDGRPVIFVFSGARLKPAQWTEIVARLRATGRNPLLIGESTRSAWLDPFAGEFHYASNQFSVSEFLDFDHDQSLRVRTYHLLRSTNGPRRIWASTVSPGYDDTRLTDGRIPRVTDRAGAAYYDAQWTTALATGPDWILVTSWNEWWENTEIEPSERYSDQYVRRTRFWADLFHSMVKR